MLVDESLQATEPEALIRANLALPVHVLITLHSQTNSSPLMQVLVDESTQATEPEALIPLVMGAKQVTSCTSVAFDDLIRPLGPVPPRSSCSWVRHKRPQVECCALLRHVCSACSAARLLDDGVRTRSPACTLLLRHAAPTLWRAGPHQGGAFLL